MADHGDRKTRPTSADVGVFLDAVGFSPRKAALTFYGLIHDDRTGDLLARLGRHTTGKGCLYVERLDDVDREVLDELIARAWATSHVEAATE